MPKLVIERGFGRGDAFCIMPGETLLLGRDPKAVDIVLADALVSRRHMRIEGRADGFYVCDEGSLNGVYVNGELVREAKIAPGDRIEAGDCLLSFLADDERRASGGLIGCEVNGHRIIQRIGRGGMGTVYKAVQLSLDRHVAIKFLSPELLRDPQFVERFIAEARAAGQLNHRNIVQVFDTGNWQGLCYHTMEYMPFGSLAEQIAGGERVPVANAVPMMIDVAEGLLYAEKRGIVHRDIKPANLMIGFEGVVKIGDLGIAKMLQDRPRVAQADGVYGSAHYMAPEQAEGKPVDCRVDIYAMGATFFRVLSGRHVFTGRSRHEISLKHILKEAPPLRSVEPSIPEPLAAIIDRMLAKRPRDRFRSAADFLDDLRALAAILCPEAK